MARKLGINRVSGINRGVTNQRNHCIELKPLQIQQLEIAGDDSDSGLDSDGNYGRVGGLRRRTFASKNSVRSEMESRNENRNSRPTSVLSRLVGSSTPAFWTYIAGRYNLYRIKN